MKILLLAFMFALFFVLSTNGRKNNSPKVTAIASSKYNDLKKIKSMRSRRKGKSNKDDQFNKK